MTELKNRIKALEKLGNYFSDISDKDSQYEPLFDAIERQPSKWMVSTRSLYGGDSVWGAAANPKIFPNG